MSLPSGFNDSQEYFRQANEFLKRNSWIFREANTEFIKAGVLEEMPQEFHDYFLNVETEELNKFPYVHEPLADLKVKALIQFRQKVAELIPLEAYNEPNSSIEKATEKENLRKMSIKKQHEIQRLAATVVKEIKHCSDKAERQQQTVFIDFGSGLGYLSELLYKLNKNLLILGLEADSCRVEAAEKRLNSYMPTACKSIKYRQHFIAEDSKDFIMKTAEEVFKLNYEQTTTKMVIIGLHACADLTITSMQLFLQLPQVAHLIIMPCCYHKLQVCENVAAHADADAVADTHTSSSANLKFRNFPISESFKQVLSDNKDQCNEKDKCDATNEAFSKYLNRPFLRLACQQTLKRWSKCSDSQHQAHGIEMFFRAAAELLKQEEDVDDMELLIVKRKDEKIVLTSLPDKTVQSFETFRSWYALKSKKTNEIVDWSESHEKKFSQITKKYRNGGKIAEGLTCLQASMQKLCENLVLYDRLCFM